jgi:hypothetical protein
MRRNSECVNNNDNQYKPTKVSRMLKEYFDENGMKQSEIAKELEVTQSAVCNQLSGRPFGRATANIWSDTFGFDIGWLMTGEGEIFYSKYPKYILPADKNRFINKTTLDGNTLLPVIPAWMFRAPNIIIDECINNKTYKKQLEYMPVVQQFRLHDIFARCPGDAMSPKICKGNIVALKKLNIEDIKYSITTIYGINIEPKGFILRKIRDNNDGTLTCIPVNMDKFEPFNINKDDVIECFEVVGVMNDNI